MPIMERWIADSVIGIFSSPGFYILFFMMGYLFNQYYQNSYLFVGILGIILID